MRRVIVETPFAGDVPRNLRYLRACMRDCLKRDEAPFASHAIYTQPGVLDDGDTDERNDGIHAGFQWRGVADATIVYTDLGTSGGMKSGIAAATALIVKGAQHRVEYRVLGDGWERRAIETEATFKTVWPSTEILHAATVPLVMPQTMLDGAVAQYAKLVHDEAVQLLEGFCDVVGFAIPKGEKFTRRDFIEGVLREMVSLASEE
jgi:hypothetical protein